MNPAQTGLTLLPNHNTMKESRWKLRLHQKHQPADIARTELAWNRHVEEGAEHGLLRPHKFLECLHTLQQDRICLGSWALLKMPFYWGVSLIS